MRLSILDLLMIPCWMASEHQHQATDCIYPAPSFQELKIVLKQSTLNKQSVGNRMFCRALPTVHRLEQRIMNNVDNKVGTLTSFGFQCAAFGMPVVRACRWHMANWLTWTSHSAKNNRFTTFLVVHLDALAQASDFRIERRQVVFLCWMQDSNPEGLWNRISQHS